MTDFATTPRTTLHRKPDRGSHERALVHAIIDETLICHVGFAIDGVPYVLPTAHVRIGDALYLHGARKNRMLLALCDGREAAVTFSLLDGLVFARTAFHHSMNYRSAMLLARGSEVTDTAEKLRVLHALVEHVAPGRMSEVRAPSPAELSGTLIVRLPVAEASAKVRTGPPVDHESELGLPHFAGVLPLRLSAGAIERAPELAAETGVSPAVANAARLRGHPTDLPLEWMREGVLVSTERARLDLDFVHAFLRDESYWARGIARERLARAVAHSVCFGLYAAGQQIGFARVATDFGRIAYLADVFVVTARRGQGLGKFLIECVLAHPELAYVDRWLLGTRDAHGFYERFGFARPSGDRLMGRLAG